MEQEEQEENDIDIEVDADIARLMNTKVTRDNHNGADNGQTTDIDIDDI